MVGARKSLREVLGPVRTKEIEEAALRVIAARGLEGAGWLRSAKEGEFFTALAPTATRREGVCGGPWPRGADGRRR